MDSESSLLAEIVDKTTDPISLTFTPEEEEIVRNFSLSPQDLRSEKRIEEQLRTLSQWR
ncbi:unnamed protein product, partial [Allacma fusca]